MEWAVEADFGNTRNNNGTFSAIPQCGDVIIEVSEKYQGSSIVDVLSSFTRVRFLQSVPNAMTLVGNNVARTFKFKSDDAIPNIWDLFHKFFEIRAVPGANREFDITCRNKALKEGRKTVNPLSASQRPEKRISETNFVRPVPFHVNESNMGTFFSNRVLQFFEIRPSAVISVWEMLMDIEQTTEDIHEFDLLCNQFTSLPLPLWVENPDLRESLHRIDALLDLSPLTTPSSKKAAFYVLFAYCFENLVSKLESPEIIDLVVFLVRNTCVSQDESGRIITASGETKEIKEYASFIFTILNKICSSQFWNPTVAFHDEILNHLDSISMVSGYEIRRIGFKSIYFLGPFMRTAFTLGRLPDDQMLLFTYFASQKFNEIAGARYIAAAISVLEKQLTDIPQESPAMFEDVFKRVLRNTPIEAFLLKAF